MNRRCMAQRPLPVDVEQVRIRLDVFVGVHPALHLTTGRALMILLQEFQDDGVPVHLLQVALSGQLLQWNAP